MARIKQKKVPSFVLPVFKQAGIKITNFTKSLHFFFYQLVLLYLSYPNRNNMKITKEKWAFEKVNLVKIKKSGNIVATGKLIGHCS